jgi:ABC-type uncharacterized transport system substrate-binding protein
LNKKLIISLACAETLVSVHLGQAQQAGKISRLGFLSGSSAFVMSARIEAFRQGMGEMGYVEGKNLAIEWRYGGGKVNRLPVLAKELVRLQVVLIVVGGGTPAARAAKNATRTIPIVMTNVADPVADGLVASLAHPGGNVTGVTSLTKDLSGKRLELLKEAFPNVYQVAVLWNSAVPERAVEFRETQAAAKAMRVWLQSLKVRSPDDIDRAFEAVSREHAGALVTLPDPLTNTYAARIAELAAKKRLPIMFAERLFIDAGGLMSYGPSYAEIYRHAAIFVDKILKGAKPADLPVEQPTKFELVINLKTAKQIGVTIPPDILAGADRVTR